MINFKKEKLIKKHLGVATPDWIVHNCIKMLNEFEDIALTIPVVSNCTDWVVDYRDYDGSISKTVITGIDEDEVIYKFISDYEGLEWTTIKKVV